MELTEQPSPILNAFTKLAYDAKMEELYNENATYEEISDLAAARLYGFRLALTIVLPKSHLDAIQSRADTAAKLLCIYNIGFLLDHDNAPSDLQIQEEVSWSEWCEHQNRADEYGWFPYNGLPPEFNCFDNWLLCIQAIEEQWLYWAEMPGCLTTAAE